MDVMFLYFLDLHVSTFLCDLQRKGQDATVHYTPRAYDSLNNSFTIIFELTSNYLVYFRNGRVLKATKTPLHSHSWITLGNKHSHESRPSDGGTVEKVAAHLTKKTVSFQNDSSQLGPGTTSAHRGSRW